MNCPELQILEDYASGDLPGPQRRGLEEHLEGCQNCRRLLARERKLDGLLRSQPLLIAPAGFRERLMAALAAQESARAYPDWLWALGLGMVVAVVGFLVGKLGSGAVQEILQRIEALIQRSGLSKGALNLQALPGADWLTQLSSAHTVLLINFAVGGAILCWGLWQMVKALRR